MAVINFVKTELNKSQVKFSKKENGREGVDFMIEKNQLYLQTINLDTSQRNLKIKKQDLGELKDNLFVALVLILDKEPKVFLFNSIKRIIASK